MATTEIDNAVKSVEVTDELISLLRAINKKLNSGDGNQGDGAFPGSKGKERDGLDNQNDKPSPYMFRWYENSLPGKDWSDTYIEGTEFPGVRNIYSDCNVVCKDLIQGADKLQFTAGYPPYEPPFENWMKIATDERARICETAGELWAIPEDGRIQFALTSEVLYPRSHRAESSEHGLVIVNQLKLFADALQQFERCGFFVADLDPFNDRLLVYKVTGPVSELILEGQLLEGQECRRSSSEDDKNFSVTATNSRDFYWMHRNEDEQPPSVDGHRLFAPLVRLSTDFNLLQYFYIRKCAPWRRIIFVRGLGSMFDSDKNGPEIQPSCPYFVTPSSSASGLWNMYARDLVAEHLRCDQVGGNTSLNPYDRS